MASITANEASVKPLSGLKREKEKAGDLPSPVMRDSDRRRLSDRFAEQGNARPARNANVTGVRGW